MSSTLMKNLKQAIDSVMFAKAELGFTADPAQESVLRSTKKHIIYLAGRQTGKSVISALKALHQAVFYPKSLILLLSPSLRQSGELFRKVSEFATQYRGMPKLVEDSKLFMTLENGSRIVSLPGKEATVRGYSNVALLICDESAQIEDRLYFSIRPMLAVSEGQLILISSARRERGFFYNAWNRGGKNWEKVKLSSEDCPRISGSFLEEERASLPEDWYRMEYCAEFMPCEGAVIRREDIERAFVDTIKPLFSDMVSDKIKPLEV